MGRRSNNDSVIMIIAYIIGFVFVIIGYSIKFLETVHKYHQWPKFWLTFPFLCLGNYLAYIYWNKNSDMVVTILLISWVSFAIYWCVILSNAIEVDNQLIQAQKEEIIQQLGVATPNCPYCGTTLKKMPMRKTRCPYCGEFIYVRTSPINNKTYLVQEDDVQELEAQWRKKK